VRFERPEIITLHGIACRFSTSSWNVDEHTLQKPYCEPAWKPELLRPAKKPRTRDFSGFECESSRNTTDTREGMALEPCGGTCPVSASQARDRQRSTACSTRTKTEGKKCEC
jgi:hypothetical protein